MGQKPHRPEKGGNSQETLCFDGSKGNLPQPSKKRPLKLRRVGVSCPQRGEPEVVPTQAPAAGVAHKTQRCALSAAAQSGAALLGGFMSLGRMCLMKSWPLRPATLGLGLVGSEVPTTKPGSRESLFPEILRRALLYRDTKSRGSFGPCSIPFY